MSAAVERIRVALLKMRQTWALQHQKEFRLACNTNAMAEVIANIDAQQQLIRGYVDDKQELEERVAEQAREIERLRADAARYQWLRNQHQRFNPVCHLVWKRGPGKNIACWVNTTALDTDIDAAMK